MIGESTYRHQRARWKRLRDQIADWHRQRADARERVPAGRRAHRMVVGLGIHNASQRKFLRRG